MEKCCGTCKYYESSSARYGYCIWPKYHMPTPYLPSRDVSVSSAFANCPTYEAKP